MPEYLAPGVYVEETSFRSKSIEGVSTSTAGFVGPARWGPVSGRPELITSLADFQRYYGGLDDLIFEGMAPQPNYLAHAVRAFFEEGGKRLYVSRVFNFDPKTAQGIEKYYAVFPPPKKDNAPPAPVIFAPVILQARFPGAAGSMRISFTLKAGSNILSWSGPPDSRTPTLPRVQEFTLLYIRKATTASETSAALRAVVNKFVNIAKLLQNVAEAEAGANAQPVKAAIKDVADGLKDTASAVVSALNAASVTTPQTAAQAARAKASKYTEDPNKAVADWIATVAEVEANKNGASVQSVKAATKNAADVLISATDAITAIVDNVSDTGPKSAVIEALKAEAEKPTVDSARNAADQVAKAAEAKTTTQAEVYQAAKEAADNLKKAVDAVVSAIDIASIATPLSVAKAALNKASEYKADPGKSVANLVAKATEDEAGKTGATPDKVKKAADHLKAIVDAIVGAVDTAAGINPPPEPKDVAKAALNKASEYKADPGISVANLVAKATEDAATAGATVEIVKKTADDLKIIVDAIANVGDIASVQSQFLSRKLHEQKLTNIQQIPAKPQQTWLLK